MARPGARIQPVTLYSDKEEVESAFKTATKPWICYNCRKTYSLLESMGSLECCQHPGTIQENGVWSCCGNKIYPVRWATNIDVQRLYTGPGCQQSPPKVRGCQPCDHNTSNKMWNHTDSTEIAALSALLPFMNKEFPFVLRKGFDQGVLRRCMKRELHLPPEIGAEVYYLKNDGQTAIHTVQWYRVNTTIVYTDENNVNCPRRTADLPSRSRCRASQRLTISSAYSRNICPSFVSKADLLSRTSNGCPS